MATTNSGSESLLDHDLQKYFNVVVAVARKAGEMIKGAWHTDKKIDTKDCYADLVTETDQNVEKYIISSFKENFPSHKFIGEESVAAGIKCELTDVPTWIIDPVDGTTNFVHRFPFSCVSIGLAVNKKIEIGVVYNPILDEMFTARNGQGAFCNGKKLHVTSTTELDKALVMAEFGSQRIPEILDAKFKTMRNIITKAHGIRVAGSAALAMCYVAAGTMDAYTQEGTHVWDMAAGDLLVREADGVVLDTEAMAMAQVAAGRADCYTEYGVHVWDIAAGYLLVKEAGGAVVDTNGGEFDMMARRVLCTGTAELAKQIVPLLHHVEYERD